MYTSNLSFHIVVGHPEVLLHQQQLMLLAGPGPRLMGLRPRKDDGSCVDLCIFQRTFYVDVPADCPLWTEEFLLFNQSQLASMAESNEGLVFSEHKFVVIKANSLDEARHRVHHLEHLDESISGERGKRGNNVGVLH